jgi:hypothetical protein
MSDQNVYFVGVSRIASGEGLVVSSYSYKTDIELSGVKSVLEQPDVNILPGKHYSFTVGQVAWHLIQDDNSLIYILICQQSYPQRVAITCLEEVQRQFCSKVDVHKAATAKDGAFSRTCAQLFQKICDKYDNLSEVDKLSAVSKKVETVKLTMQENVDLALQNCVKLETIEAAAEELQQQAGVFKKSAHDLKNKMWWKNIKMWLIIGFIVLLILGIIIGVATSYAKKK